MREQASIVLLPGSVAAADRVGHHDYLAGCAALTLLLEQTPGLSVVTAPGGWPENESLLDQARSVVFYSGGGGKQALLQTPHRIERIERLVDHGVGIVMIHQAVSYPAELAEQARRWIGGAHVRGISGRGHWKTHHHDLPDHPATRGVEPWRTKDGWLNEIQFVPEMKGVTPLVWSGKMHQGSSAGGIRDVVCWAYDRPSGGRSFCFTGLDAHSAWSLPSIRQLMVNGILWSAGLEIPGRGAPCAVDEATLHGLLTPRRWPGVKILRALRRAVQHAAR